MSNNQNGQWNQKQNRKGPCHCCVRAVKWVPVIFIFAIICWSYYAFVIQLCLLTAEGIAEKIILIILYHIVCSLFLWSYYQTIFVKVASVPPEFRLKPSELQSIYTAENESEQKELLEQFSRNLPITNRTITGAVRFCDKCAIMKPDRAHHCSVCGECILKMDHHCPWVNNCVNFSNYKFFVLFLGYALLYCLYIALASLPYFIMFWKGHLEGRGAFHILFLFFVSVMFAISLVSLFVYHVYLVLVNRTTLEAFRPAIFRIGGPDKHGFSLGYYNNFQEVFGDDKRYWFIPVFTSLGTGAEYKVQEHHLQPPNNFQANYESMGVTRPGGDTTSTNSTIININSPINNNNMSHRLAHNIVAPQSSPTKSDQHQEQQHQQLHDSDDRLFVRSKESERLNSIRSDKVGDDVSDHDHSNAHLLNHNSTVINV